MAWWLIGISYPSLKNSGYPPLRADSELSLFIVEIDQSNYHYIYTHILKKVGLKLAELLAVLACSSPNSLRRISSACLLESSAALKSASEW